MSLRSNVDARRLDQPIRIERKIETRDAIGDVIVAWLTLIATRAAVDSSKVSQERPGQDGIVLGQQLTFTVRADVVDRFAVTTSTAFAGRAGLQRRRHRLQPARRAAGDALRDDRTESNG
jgi:head-tail adaptor